MKKIITLSCFCLLFVVLFFIMGTQSACQKQNTNCTCVISVDSGSGSNILPVAGATVKLYAPHAQNGGTGTTNASGEVNFNFSLPAIYNIAVTKATGIQGDTLKGTGIIQ